ncbi:hypothetical protein ABNB59_20600 [Paenibacillus larvae]|uniref:Transglycosylase n=5 Tax=root TaxID=1 RepID=A0A0K2CZ85_9CAUD|nr:hypothetical protein [Paenibacillus larvae]YP_009196182.1 transglycosylase [Paenibacillus phage Vegas]ALA12810.1 transglycosylase [Paenibacillus phage Hayley]ALA12897.1 transglycosylase [Paenibacillus phage Vadim]ALA12983.1 transglycosylase [Paenibacillus phage Diane]UYE92103.1 hypothetical protein LUNBUN_79 [Paenibacillus phage LunBun]UYE92185.1 hypothetical protein BARRYFOSTERBENICIO_79 [Paenibacillus phage BarryFoster_Benicio]UYL91549.1 hypothetical protein ABATENZ_79 [Paenibacillus ph
MKAICNKGCNKEFFAAFRTKRLKNGIEKIFFTCSQCGEEYVCYYTDPDIRQDQKRLRYLRLKSNKKEHDELHQKIKMKMDALKARMGSLS